MIGLYFSRAVLLAEVSWRREEATCTRQKQQASRAPELLPNLQGSWRQKQIRMAKKNDVRTNIQHIKKAEESF